MAEAAEKSGRLFEQRPECAWMKLFFRAVEFVQISHQTARQDMRKYTDRVARSGEPREPFGEAVEIDEVHRQAVYRTYNHRHSRSRPGNNVGENDAVDYCKYHVNHDRGRHDAKIE